MQLPVTVLISCYKDAHIVENQLFLFKIMYTRREEDIWNNVSFVFIAFNFDKCIPL